MSDTKICNACGREKPIGEFYRKNRNRLRDGYMYVCKECAKLASNERHSDNRRKTREFLGEYLSQHGCVDCSETDIRCLEFDHIQGDKKRAISAMLNRAQSLGTIKKEIEKCEVRCANCHRKRTADQFGTSWRLLYHASGTLGN